MSDSFFTVRLEPSNLTISGRGGRVLGNIYPLTEDAPSDSAWRNISIPVSADPNCAIEIPAAPGEYLVECVLPSGEMLNNPASLRKNERKEVVLREKILLVGPKGGPLLIGEDIRSHTGVGLPGGLGMLIASGDGPEKLEENWNFRVAQQAVGAMFQGKVDPILIEKLLKVLAESLLEVSAASDIIALRGPKGWDTRHALIDFSELPNLLQDLWYMSLTQKLAVIEESVPEFLADNLPRQYFKIRPEEGKQNIRNFMKWTPEGVELISLPSRWHQVDGYEKVGFGSMSDTSDGARRFRSKVSVDDPYFSTIFAYLSAGSLPQAEAILREAEKMLFEKIANPYAAAAGAYVLINRGVPEQDADWPRWVENLSNWFPWLPDGAVTLGWLRLAQGQHNEAKQRFMEAYNRGVPLFSLGVRKLLEGLQMFDDNEHCKELARSVQMTARRTNMSECFTVTLLGPSLRLSKDSN